MATTPRKPSTDTASKAEPAKDATATKATETQEKDERSYSEHAASLADDVRALAEEMREKIDEVVERCGKVNETSPNPDELQAANGVRRIPMAADDVRRALEGLVAVSADLALKVQR